MASASTVTKKGCTYTITHRIHFAVDRTLPAPSARSLIQSIKEELRLVWSSREHRFGEAGRCTLRIRFEYVDRPAEDVDTKMLVAGRGRCSQSWLGPERTLGLWFPEDPHWTPRVAAHEVGHELGMDDKYEDGSDEPTVPGYPRDGIAFDSHAGSPKPQDYEEILAAHGIRCECAGRAEEKPRKVEPEEESPRPEEPPRQSSPELRFDWPLTEGGPSPFLPWETDEEDDSRPEEVPRRSGDDITPIVLVPGLMGSWLGRLDSKGRIETIWPTPKLRPDLRPLRPSRAKIPAGLYPGAYDALVSFICTPRPHGLGRTLNEDFWIFPYDWTRTNLQSAHALNRQIEVWLAAANKKRRAAGRPEWKNVDVICHSMGGLVTRAAWKLGGKISKVVFLATPHFGAPYLHFVLHPESPAYLQLADWFRMASYRAIWKTLRAPNQNPSLDEALWELAVSMDSSYELLPDGEYLATTAMIFKLPGDVALYGTTHSYFGGRSPVGEIHSFPRRDFDKPNVADMRPRVRRGLQFKRWLGETLPPEHLCVYSDSEWTVNRINHTFGIGFGAPYAGPRIPNGDGRVPRRSAYGPDEANAVRVSGAHDAIPNARKIHRLIRRFLA